MERLRLPASLLRMRTAADFWYSLLADRRANETSQTDEILARITLRFHEIQANLEIENDEGLADVPAITFRNLLPAASLAGHVCCRRV